MPNQHTAPIDPLTRFIPFIQVTETCWLWTGKIERNGYGRFWLNGSQTSAHRFAYETWNGPIPKGMQIDHVKSRGCTNRHCVNPDHLEVVTSRENMQRGGAWLVNGQKTHCPRGHEYTPENTYLQHRGNTTMRQCKACSRIRAKTRST